MRLPQQRSDSNRDSNGDNLSRTWAPGRAQRRSSDVSGQGSLPARNLTWLTTMDTRRAHRADLRVLDLR